jgi:hypothetical protein
MLGSARILGVEGGLSRALQGVGLSVRVSGQMKIALQFTAGGNGRKNAGRGGGRLNSGEGILSFQPSVSRT